MKNLTSRQINLAKYASGLPEEGSFMLEEVPVGEPEDNEVLVQNIFMSVDPYMLGRMSVRAGDQPYKIGQPLAGGCVGKVIESHNGDFKAGDYVLGNKGWREYYISDGAELAQIDPDIAPVQAYLGILGMPGFTAYYGLLHLGKPKEGETVYVSAASGAVGSAACQIARIKGCRAVGSAGSGGKIKWLKEEAGIQAAFNYKKSAALSQSLAQNCPDGIDIYFDNVGGKHLDAALARMNANGRVVLCGMLSQYAAKKPDGIGNLFLAIRKQLRLQGFLISAHSEHLQDFYRDMGKWISEGHIRWKETILDGIENAPKAFIGLFKGENMGKMLVRLNPGEAREL